MWSQHGFGLVRMGHHPLAMTLPQGTGTSETTERLLEQSRELLKDMDDRLSADGVDLAGPPAEDG